MPLMKKKNIVFFLSTYECTVVSTCTHAKHRLNLNAWSLQRTIHRGPSQDKVHFEFSKDRPKRGAVRQWQGDFALSQMDADRLNALEDGGVVMIGEYTYFKRGEDDLFIVKKTAFENDESIAKMIEEPLSEKHEGLRQIRRKVGNRGNVSLWPG